MRRKVSSFYKLLFSYLLILLIPIIFGTYVHYQTLHSIEEDAKKTGLAVLDQTSRIVDEQLNFILGITNRLSVNGSILRFSNVSPPLTDQNHYELTGMSRELTSHLYLNVYVKDIVLYFSKSDTMLTTRGVFRGSEEYEYFLKYGNLSYDEWSAKMMTPKYTFHAPEVVHARPDPFETIAFTAPINLGSGPKIEGAIVIYIDEAKIKSLLEPLTGNTGGFAFAVNSDRTLMVTTEAEPSIPIEAVLYSDRESGYVSYGSNRYYVTSTVSENSDWEYYSIIPEDVLLQKLNYIEQTVWTITVVSLLAGALTALYLSYRNRRPLARLLREIADSGKLQGTAGEDEFEYILNTYKQVASSRDDLISVMEQQLPVLRTVFIEKVMRGEFKDDEEAKTFAERARLSVGGAAFVWIVIRMEMYDGTITDAMLQELQFGKFVIKNLAGDVLGTDVTHDLSENTVAVLACSPETRTEYNPKLKAELEQLRYYLTEKFRMSVSIAAGSSRLTLSDSWKSYCEAVGALDFAEPNRITWSELLDMSSDYYYPIEIENKLMQTVKSGEAEALDSLLEHIFQENFSHRKLSVESKRQLIMELKGSAFKIAGQILKSGDALRMEVERSVETVGHDDAAQAYGELVAAFRELHRLSLQQKKEQHRELIHQMLEYVETRFDDANLSLSTLSSHFALTENYISFLFKDRTGNNFSSYLEHLRMEKACELLATTDLSIQDIAVKVGYTNDKSFRRAFKRVKGLQPTAYRDQEMSKML